MRARNVKRLVAILALASVAVGVGVTLATVRNDGPDCDAPFDRRAWQAARSNDESSGEWPKLRRIAVVLVACDKLLGLTRHDLHALLGRPTGTDIDGNPRPHRESRWRLGLSGPSGSEDVLFVEYERGRVVYAEAPEDIEHGGYGRVESGRPVGGGAKRDP